ncbi:hypothetical protein EYF80_042136 [Liparis tanakae]|uniref:Uncharacterized protein n=1 Tax=Liparis tanakae TaxID=230148 RepID=A0A4Z2G262_9TELE|nr:hypothetical protein EYF80_042136 [Liparis tanakae]
MGCQTEFPPSSLLSLRVLAKWKHECDSTDSTCRREPECAAVSPFSQQGAAELRFHFPLSISEA